MHREVRSKILLKKSLETKSKWQRLTAEAGGFGTVNPRSPFGGLFWTQFEKIPSFIDS